MKKLALISICLVFCFGSTFAQDALNVQQAGTMLNSASYVDQELIVKFKDTTQTFSTRLGVASMKSLTVKKEIYRVKVEGDMEATLAAMLADPNVAYAEPNYIVHHFGVEPNDPKYGDLWGMKKIQAPEAWDVATKADSLIVAVIDTGVDYEHPDLVDNMWTNEAEKNGTTGVDDDNNGYIDDIHGWNGAGDNGDPMDDHNHGTHCSGTIAGVGDNNIGVAGVCWKAKIMGCKFLTASGSGSLADAIECIDYAVANGAKVLSNSWGGGGFSVALYEAIENAGKAGVLFVAAAGNSYSSSLSYPARYCEDATYNGKTYPGLKNVLSVAASTETDGKASFSQYSATANKNGDMIAAPGTNIVSTVRGKSYASYNGTSMATPHVAGAATLVWATHPTLSYVALKNRLVNRGDDLEWSLWSGTLKVKRLNLNASIGK